VQESDWHRQKLLHPAIHMNSEQPNVLATIASTSRTCPALAAAHIRFNRASVTATETSLVFWYLNNNPGQLVA
jgi:hypothetical protein